MMSSSYPKLSQAQTAQLGSDDGLMPPIKIWKLREHKHRIFYSRATAVVGSTLVLLTRLSNASRCSCAVVSAMGCWLANQEEDEYLTIRRGAMPSRTRV